MESGKGMGKRKKVRTAFRKNRSRRQAKNDLTREFREDSSKMDDIDLQERVSGKGELTRKRTVVLTEGEEGGSEGLSEGNLDLVRGRVLSAHGLYSRVLADNGVVYQCAIRRILKTLATDQRHVIAAGDWVFFRPVANDEGMIERVEPRTATLRRSSRGRKHLIAANVEQLIIIASAAEPYLKPNLIDRYLVSAESDGLQSIICINKIDLCDQVSLQPLVGVYSQMGYDVLLVSATKRIGIERLRNAMRNRVSVLSGQSGVGKSSLINSVAPQLQLQVGSVSQESQKGRHTTTTSQLLTLDFGGYVVDTPGIRQYELWDVIPQEVAGFYRDIRSYVSLCRYPNCSHTHETECAVKDAVADGHIDARRFESYCNLYEGDPVE